MYLMNSINGVLQKIKDLDVLVCVCVCALLVFDLYVNFSFQVV